MQPNDWENPLLQGWGCRPAHATLMPYPDATTALHGSRFASPFYCSLNEEWQFYLAPNPSVVPTFQQPDYDASNWAICPTCRASA